VGNTFVGQSPDFSGAGNGIGSTGSPLTSQWSVGQVPIGGSVVYQPVQDTSILDRYLSSFFRWAARTIPAGVVDDKLVKSNLPIPALPKTFADGAPGSLATAAKQTIGWEHLLGINANPVTPQEMDAARQSLKGYQDYVKNRFNAPRISVGQVGGPLSTLKQLFLNNFKGMATALEQGKYLTAASSILGQGLFALGIGRETWQGYQRAAMDEQSQGGDAFSTMAKTAGAFVKATAKAGVAWEIGNIGFRVGSVLAGPWGALAGTVGGIALGALGSVATKITLDGADHLAFGDPRDYGIS
jgi:hypothetical protein